MRRVPGKFVPKMLVEQQKQVCMKIYQDILDCANHYSDSLKTIISGDEIWFYGV